MTDRDQPRQIAAIEHDSKEIGHQRPPALKSQTLSTEPNEDQPVEAYLSTRGNLSDGYESVLMTDRHQPR